MSIQIHIDAHPDRGDMGNQIDRAMSALGFVRRDVIGAEVKEPAHENLVLDEAAFIADEKPQPETKQADPDIEIDTRAVGSPADGNKRRNSVEKNEDDEFESVALRKGIAIEKVNAAISNVGRDEAMLQLREQPDASEKPSISTGDNRVGPEDEPENEAQDKADEQAETEASGGLAPVDELRRLVGTYQSKFGMPAAIALCQEGGAIGKGIHELDDDEIGEAIEAVTAALSGAKKADAKPAERSEQKATAEDLKKAMMAYALKFDGQNTDMANIPNTNEDVPRIFELLFGEGVTKFSQVPVDGYGKAVAGINEAIQKNPFKR